MLSLPGQPMNRNAANVANDEDFGKYFENTFSGFDSYSAYLDDLI